MYGHNSEKVRYGNISNVSKFVSKISEPSLNHEVTIQKPTIMTVFNDPERHRQTWKLTEIIEE